MEGLFQTTQRALPFKRHREPYQEILKHDAKMAKLMNVGEGLGIMTSNFHQVANV